MFYNMELIVLIVTLICVGTSYGRLVDLRPDENGDHVAVVEDGKVAYLPVSGDN